MNLYGIEDDVIKGLFPSPIVIIATLISFLIVLFVVTKFSYNPIKEIVKTRSEYIRDNIKDAEASNEKAKFNHEESIVVLDKAKNEAKQIVESAIHESLQKSSDLLQKAQVKSETLLEETRLTTEKEYQEAKEKIKTEISDIALEAAMKILEKEIDSSINKKLIDDFLKDLNE